MTLLADRSVTQCQLPIRQAAGYGKQSPAFSDALAVVRHQLWQSMAFHTSPSDTEVAKVPRILLNRLTEALCYAAWRFSMDNV